jgi:sterol desaturase/sphingolipid hydroxylase (fatty acid hydroxylase superfamily)
MENELFYRLSIFIGLFACLALLEHIMPRRTLDAPKGTRWFTNWAFTFVNTAALRLLAIALPLLAVGAAIDAQTSGIGLFNLSDFPVWLEVILAIIILDFAIWFQHVITHKIPILWRLHQVHHADRDMDVTTAIRFHPIEIALSMIFKIGLVYALGAPAIAVIIFEILLNGCAMFNHANIKLPLNVDRWVRLVLVTPDMHRVHHSIERAQHDSNYGFSLSIWDRMFGTYIPQPKEGHDAMEIGLRWRDDRPTKLAWSMLLPFRK